jgi:TPR repeat protein
MRAAETGHIGGQMALGNSYFQGPPFSEDYREAMKWYRKVAEQGSVWGQSKLAWMYCTVVPYYNSGVTDYAEGVKWYKKAADQGSVEAMNALAQMHEKGNGVVQDYAEAMRWYKMAQQHGDKSAAFWIKRLLGKPGFAYAQAAKWFAGNSATDGNPPR